MTSKRFGAGFNFPGLSPPSNKPVLIWDPENPATFLELVDTISSYATHAGKALVINSNEDGITVSSLAIVSDKNYTHVQGVAAITWTISHTLAKYASIIVVDAGGHVIVGDIEYVDTSTIKVNFVSATAGTAYLN